LLAVMARCSGFDCWLSWHVVRALILGCHGTLFGL
jgi:hypothetical protein